MQRVFCVIVLSLFLGLFSWEAASALDELNDEFENPQSLEQWSRLFEIEGYPDKIHQLGINESDSGLLTIIPNESLWWRGYHGTFLYKEISGDFIVTTKVNIEGRDGEYPDFPNVHWQIAGILIRTPIDLSASKETRKENWMFNAYGSGIYKRYLIDIGTTVDNEYVCYPFSGKDGWTELRMIRFRDTIVAMTKNEHENWQVRTIIRRDDFPETLQVGLMTNSSGYKYPYERNLMKDYEYDEYNMNTIELQNKPDVTCHFDYIRFRRPIPKDGTNIDEIITDRTKILEHFGF